MKSQLLFTRTLLKRYRRDWRMLTLGVALSSTVLAALPAVSPKPADTQRADAIRATMAASKSWFAKGNLAKGEEVLFATNANARGSAAWYMESAAALVRTATSFQSQGDATTAVLLGREALAQLAKAEKQVDARTQSALAARIKVFAGQICENVAGDSDAATAYFQAAAQLNPKNSVAAAALARRQKSDGELAARLSAPKH